MRSAHLASDLARYDMTTRLQQAGFLLLLALATAEGALGQQNYLPNGDFDADVVGWALEGNPSASMAWDGSQGSPSPGSLRVSLSPGVSLEGAFAGSECVNAPSGSLWTLTVEAREEVGSTLLGCTAFLVLHQTTNCSDPAAAFAVTQQSAGPDWTPLSVSHTMSQGFAGLRVGLNVATSSGAVGACNFDNATLLGPSVLDVPALGWRGVLALIIALAAVGVILLRGSR